VGGGAEAVTTDELRPPAPRLAPYFSRPHPVVAHVSKDGLLRLSQIESIAMETANSGGLRAESGGARRYARLASASLCDWPSKANSAEQSAAASEIRRSGRWACLWQGSPYWKGGPKAHPP